MNNELQISEDQLRVYGIFHPYAHSKTIEAQRRNQRFAYYTSADTAMRILRNGEIRMRKSHMMNDFREIEHGFDCLRGALEKNRRRMLAVFDDMFPGFCERLETIITSWLPHFRTDSYITCMSEHDSSEDQHGRLSMWRAYGGGAGVALVVNGGPILRASDALKAYTSPVAYFQSDQVDEAFAQILSNVENNRDRTRLEIMTSYQPYQFNFQSVRLTFFITKVG